MRQLSFAEYGSPSLMQKVISTLQGLPALDHMTSLAWLQDTNNEPGSTQPLAQSQKVVYSPEQLDILAMIFTAVKVSGNRCMTIDNLVLTALLAGSNCRLGHVCGWCVGCCQVALPLRGISETGLRSRASHDQHSQRNRLLRLRGQGEGEKIISI